MKLTNEVYISGTVSNDVRRCGNGPYRFTLVIRGGKKRDGSRYPDEFFPVMFWADTFDDATVARLRSKTFVEVAGRLKFRTWTSDGIEHRDIDVQALEIKFPEPEPKPLTPDYERELYAQDRDIQNIPF